jgi:hypothetical protein
MRALPSDVRHPTRLLLRARGFTSVTVGALASALALAVMTVVNAYLFRGLPNPESERLYSVRYSQPVNWRRGRGSRRAMWPDSVCGPRSGQSPGTLWSASTLISRQGPQETIRRA